jgi:hypothetical protein
MSNKYGIFEMKNTACEKNVFQGMAPTLKGCKLAQRMFHLKRHIFLRSVCFRQSGIFLQEKCMSCKVMLQFWKEG